MRRLIVTILATICLIIIYKHSNAQSDPSLGNWNSIIIRGKISPRFALMGEGNIRSANYDLKYDYFEVKTGISYPFAKNLTGLFGTGIYNTYQPGGLFQSTAKQKEFRTWLELSFKQVYNRFYFDHRARLEQRFIPKYYKNRFRYRFGVTLSVNRAELASGTIYLTVNDELWMPQYGPFIERNRFCAGTGYKINGNTAFQISHVSDTDYKSGNHTIKNYLQLMLIYDISKLHKNQPDFI